MSITRSKSGKTWAVSVQVNKRRFRKTVSSYRQAKELEASVRKQFEDEAHNQTLGRKPRRTLKEAMKQWLETEVPQMKSSRQTINHARQVLPWLEDYAIEDTAEAAALMKASMVAAGLSESTQYQRLAILRRLSNLAEEWGWITNAPHIKIRTPKNERHIYLNEKEIHTLANAAGRARKAVLQLAYTGLRQSEFFKLKHSDVVDDCIILDADTKNSRPRIIPLANTILKFPIPPLVTRSEFRYRFEKARTKTGFEHIRPHDLRHCTAYLLIQAGVSLAIIRDILGHSNLTVTSRYSHLARDDLKEAMKKL